MKYLYEKVDYEKNIPAKILMQDKPGWRCRTELHWHKELEIIYMISGHLDVTVNGRTKAGLANGLKVILCVGETLTEREQGVTFETVSRQTKIALLGVSAEEMQNIIIAYEPVWAIGTGKTATAEQAEEVCAYIRSVVASLYGAEVAEATTVQYGGSMNAKNAAELLAMENIDGGLIGGASLKPDDFTVIVKAAD